MRACFVIFLLSSFFTLELRAQDSLRFNKFTKGVYVYRRDTLPYRLLYPANYDRHKRYPILLFLHGAGERGNDNEIQLAAIPQLLTDSTGRKKYPCFILVPQCPKNDAWVNFPNFPKILKATNDPTPSTSKVFWLLDKLLAILPVDLRRIYITGYSMGGEGTFEFLTRRPNLFSAAAPVCSVSDTSKAKQISRIPIWAFHGDQDDVNDVKYSRVMIAALKTHGGNPRYTEYLGVKHNSWTNAYSNPELFKWMFAQQLPDLTIPINECQDKKACEVFKQNLAFIKERVERNKKLNLNNVLSAILILEDITGIISRSNGDYIGRYSPTPEDFYNWADWFKANSQKLYWDEQQQKVKVR